MVPRELPKLPSQPRTPHELMIHSREQMETEKSKPVQIVTENQEILQAGRISMGLEFEGERVDSRAVEREMLHRERIDLDDL